MNFFLFTCDTLSHSLSHDPFLMLFIRLCVARGTGNNTGTSVPRSSISNRCCCGKDHEDKEIVDTQLAHNGTLWSVEVSGQSKSFHSLSLPLSPSLCSLSSRRSSMMKVYIEDRGTQSIVCCSSFLISFFSFFHSSRRIWRRGLKVLLNGTTYSGIRTIRTNTNMLHKHQIHITRKQEKQWWEKKEEKNFETKN